MIARDRRFTIAFYNLENLFDTIDDPLTHDEEFTPGSQKRWTKKRFEKKLYKLSTAISRIGQRQVLTPPVILGIAEVENRRVIDHLLERPLLKPYGYRVIHFNSPDSRGMDTALLYMESAFEPRNTERIPVSYPDKDGQEEQSRDILFAEGLLFGQDVSIYVNHWPSRREGVEVTRPHREAAAEALMMHFSLRSLGPVQTESSGVPAEQSHCIVMGDLNDRPMDPAPRLLTAGGHFQNPFDPLAARGIGSVSHRGGWYLFDQILLSPGFFSAVNSPFSFVEAQVFSPKFLGQYRGRFKGHPFRTYADNHYKGGYSDHFPVYVVLDRHDA